MLRPVTDTARKIMLESIIHGVVSVAIIAAATILAALHAIDSAAWAAAVGTGVGVSGAISVFQGRTSNGTIKDEAIARDQQVGGVRRGDPPEYPTVPTGNTGT